MSLKNEDPRTRRKILDLLKRSGPQDARKLAGELDVSPMAVRQHLYQLQEQKLVDFEEESRPKGRPAKMWRLTDAAERFFPDAHAELAVGLVAAMSQTFGAAGLEKLVAARARQQTAEYTQQIPKRASLPRRLKALAALRSEEGYMAEVHREADGGYLLVENHCPVCAAATACTGLCSAELEVFRSVLGDGVQVERTEHILEGARRCAYRVTRR